MKKTVQFEICVNGNEENDLMNRIVTMLDDEDKTTLQDVHKLITHYFGVDCGELSGEETLNGIIGRKSYTESITKVIPVGQVEYMQAKEYEERKENASVAKAYTDSPVPEHTSSTVVKELHDQIKRWQRERDQLDELIDFAFNRIDNTK